MQEEPVRRQDESIRETQSANVLGVICSEGKHRVTIRKREICALCVAGGARRGCEAWQLDMSPAGRARAASGVLCPRGEMRAHTGLA
eukprot:258494-Pleurochrysis_carterae.AAC.2